MDRRQLLGGVLAAVAVSAGRMALGAPPLVAAAANLRFVLPEINRRFEAESGHRLRLVFGSSGQFYRQILEGAPYALFLSADSRLVEELHAQGLIDSPGVVYALGRLAVFAAHGSPLEVDSQLAGLARAVAQNRLRRFAIANPKHAPYGARAREVLRRRRLWERLQPHLLFAENVAQAAQFALQGAADGGLIAHSLARAPRLSGRGRFALIPAAWHRPLDQRMALLRPELPAAAAFYAYMQQEGARRLLAAFGFALPDPA